MELRVLQYFLAVAREQSISAAAESLHLSQPTLSRQIRDMEEELGAQLLIRGNRKITLTEEGLILRRRAEEIINLVGKAEREIALSDEGIAGDIHIGAGETEAVNLITAAARRLQKDYPLVHYHISSGDACDVIEQLDKGLIDFGLVLDPINLARYDSIRLPGKDTWGVLMPNDCPLAKRDMITPEDLWDKPLIVSRQSTCNGSSLMHWFKRENAQLNIVATYTLAYYAALMVNAGMGYALCMDKVIDTVGKSSLCFRPLSPQLDGNLNIIWKKYQLPSRAAEKFLLAMQAELAKDPATLT